MTAKKLIVLSLIAGSVTGVIPASAFTTLVRGSEGMGRASVNELASEDVAILPGNPFHFVIGMSNSFKGFFISDNYNEAAFKLEIAGRGAGEVRKLLDWASDNQELVSFSLTKYSRALLDFKAKLNSLKQSDLTEEAAANLNDMIGRLLTQLRFIDDVRDSFTSPADIATLAAIDETLTDALRFIALNLSDVATFGSRIANLVTEGSDAATAVRVIGILAKLVQEVAGVEEANAFVIAIADARSTLIADLARAMQEEGSAAPAVAAFKVAAAELPVTPPTITEIVNQLADETLKAEIYALLQS
jgi:hypothetical protein